MPDSPYIADATGENFNTLVIERSRQAPVIVDFWASWCAPCRSLMPILAKLAEEYQGKFYLVKVDTDEHQALAGKYGIRSLPTVRLFKNGESVDEFMGALPESGVRAFIDRHLPREADFILDASAQALASGNVAQALALAEKAVAADPRHVAALLQLARIHAQAGQWESATSTLARVPLEHARDAAVLELTAHLSFASVLHDAPAEMALIHRIGENPDDALARYQLGCRHVMAGHYEQALEQFLELMKRDRKFNDDAARKAVIAVFDLLGGRGALVNLYRAKLATLLN